MKKVWQVLHCGAKLWEICSQWKSLVRLASICEELPPENAKLLPILECLPIWIVAGGDKEVISLVFTITQALLGNIVHGINNSAVLPHSVQNLIRTGKLAALANFISL